MPLTNSTQIGASYRWGFGEADAPNIGNGFFPTEGEIRYGPEVYTKSANGEGHTDSMTVSKPEARLWNATFKGRIDQTFDPTSFPAFFTWQNRKFVIKPDGIGQVIPKGDYHEVSIETESPALL